MATPEIIEMAPSGGGNESWIRKNWTLVLFVVLILGFIASIIYLFYITFVKTDCTCGTGDGKTDCDKCVPKKGMPPNTSCQSDSNKCKGGKTLSAFLDVTSSPIFWGIILGMGAFLIFLGIAFGLYKKIRGKAAGDETPPTLAEATAEREDNLRRAKETETDYKEYEDFIDEKLKEARGAGNTADIAKFEGQKKTLQESKAKMAKAIEDTNTARFFKNAKEALRANEKFVTQMVKAEEALGKVRKTVGDAAASKSPAEDTASKINEEAEIAEEEAHRLAREISNTPVE